MTPNKQALQRLLDAVEAVMFGGMKITVSVNAVERVLRWPEKKRSKRLIKKMTKRLGPQVYMKPAMFQTQYGLVVHPEIYAELKRQAT